MTKRRDLRLLRDRACVAAAFAMVLGLTLWPHPRSQPPAGQVCQGASCAGGEAAASATSRTVPAIVVADRAKTDR